MLGQIRNLSSTFSKVIFGFILASFVFYFGYNQLSRSRGNQGGRIAARVNEELITTQQFSASVQNQRRMFQQFSPELTPELERMIETQSLQGLVESSLLAQAARESGLRVSNDELAQAIRNHPGLQREGRFDEVLYLERFKPSYYQTNGVDFESSFRQDLLGEKLSRAIQNSVVVSQQEIETRRFLQETQLQVRKLAIPFQATGEGNKPENAEQLAQEWIAAKKSGSDTAEWLKNHALQEQELPLQPVDRLALSLGGKASWPLLQCLLSLPAGQVCQSPLKLADQWVAVQLVERKKESTQQPDEANAGPSLDAQLAQGKKSRLMRGVVESLQQRAKIRTYLAEQ